MPTPLTDAINALTRYANETTGQSDTTLSEAVNTLVEGYGQGGGEVEEAEIKIVNFLDYDARVAYSYTAQEFNELTELPSNVPHSGLVGEGWVDVTLDGIKTMLTNIPKRRIFVYPYYVTDDGSTRAYLEFVAEQTVTFGFGINGTISVDWGDGTASTLTGTKLTTKVTENHTYSAGNYVLSISVVSGSFAFGGSLNNSWFMNVNGTALGPNRAVRSALKKIEFGTNVSFNGSSVFHEYRELKAITRPTGLGTVPYLVSGCVSFVAHPFSSTSQNAVGSTAIRYFNGNAGTTSAMNGAYNLQYATIFDSTTAVGGSAFSNCYCLQELWIPSGVTSVGSSAFGGCAGMKEYHFLSTTPPTLSNTNAFSGIQSTCVIYVPYSADHSILEAYQTANNWSTYASYIQEEPQG